MIFKLIKLIIKTIVNKVVEKVMKKLKPFIIAYMIFCVVCVGILIAAFISLIKGKKNGVNPFAEIKKKFSGLRKKQEVVQ